MTQTLNELLRRGADSVAAPRLDLGEVVAEAGRRRRRRRSVVIAAAAAGVSAIVVGSALVAQTGSTTDGSSPADSPSSSAGTAVDGPVRPLVYAEGRTVHVGEKSVAADKPVAFIAPTDDGAVYEAALDGTLWFTDGTTTRVIGTSGSAAAPTSHPEAVSTGSAGSLVVWADVVHQNRSELVVYDTARLDEVGRIPFPVRGHEALVDYVGEDEVWYATDDGRTDSSIYRFDVRSGTTTSHPRSDLDAVLESRPRTFAAVDGDGRVVHGEPSFTEEAGRLVAGIHTAGVSEDAAPVTLADGSELRLRLPSAYVGPWPPDEQPALSVSQWLDDDHIVLWADDGGGDLPAKRGDFLVCPLPDGVCDVTVPRAPQPYVAPYPS
ncbi:MAG TPA: hypothetical protein VFT70_12170 [Nocardioides sp.]|nr:hypothetical protein [Nocardioides sp.]